MEDKEYLDNLDNFPDTVPYPEHPHADLVQLSQDASEVKYPKGHFLHEKEPLNRRAFLTNMAGATVVAGSLSGGVVGQLYGEEILGETIGREEEEKNLTAIRERLRSRHGVEVDFGDTTKAEGNIGIHGEGPTFLVEKRRVCEAIEDALMQYPPMMYKKRAIISRIRVLDNLEIEKNANVAGLAALDYGDMYLEHKEYREENSIAQPSGFLKSLTFTDSEKAAEVMRTKKNIQAIFHHELFHLTDMVNEKKWATEARGFSAQPISSSEGHLPLLYNHELNSLVKNSGLDWSLAEQHRQGITGFASQHARKEALEDRASTIEYLYRKPDEMARRYVEDPELARKIDFMKKEYLTMSRGVMDEGYWEMVRKYPDNPKMIAEFVKLKSRMLVGLSDEAFKKFMLEKYKLEVSDKEVAEWRAEIALGIN